MVTIGLMVGTHLPPRHVPTFVLQAAPDKVWHLAGYGTMGFLLYGGIRTRVHRRFRTCFWVLLMAAVLSVCDELTQPLAGRHRDILDFLASTGGGALGASAAVLAEILLRKWLRP